jgi:hypothetical protein
MPSDIRATNCGPDQFTEGVASGFVTGRRHPNLLVSFLGNVGYLKMSAHHPLRRGAA